MYLEDSIRNINKKLYKICKNERIIVWGASEHTVRLFQYTNILNYQVIDLVDNSKAGDVIFGRVIKSPEKILWKNIDCVVISSFYKYLEIETELIDKYEFSGEILTLYDENDKKQFYEYCSYKELLPSEPIRSIMRKNEQYKNKHKGQRVFVLCTGPSINKINLDYIKDEYSIAVSQFYMHEQYDTLNIDYHCLVDLRDYNGYPDIAVKMLSLMEKKGNPTFFVNINQKDLIQKRNLLKGKNINYVDYRVMPYDLDDIDLTLPVMGVQSVAVLAIEIAIYMGFKEIYLLGMDYDRLFAKKHCYFYDRSKSIVADADNTTNRDGTLISSYGEEFRIHNILWRQLEELKKMCVRNHIKICNATKGGIIDVFERVNYENLFI